MADAAKEAAEQKAQPKRHQRLLLARRSSGQVLRKQEEAEKDSMSRMSWLHKKSQERFDVNCWSYKDIAMMKAQIA